MSVARTTIECHPSGTFFDFADPRPEMIHVEDIARSLSHVARFGGHTRFPYSVAQHALLVARLVREAGGSRALQFAALHHDSHEAYLGDIPTPLKALLDHQFRCLTGRVDTAIAQRFGLPFVAMRGDAVKAADEQALAIEACLLKRSRGVGWTRQPCDIPTGAGAALEPQWVEHLFLAAHASLCS